MTTLDTRVPVPSFEATLRTLVEQACAYPHYVSRKQYLSEEGFPEDLVAYALHLLDAPIQIAARGYDQLRGHTPRPRNIAPLPTLWNRLFTGEEYDGRFVLFLGKHKDISIAEDYLVFALLNHIVTPDTDNAGMTMPWREDLIRGIKSFRRFLNSKSSGYLVQVSTSDENGKFVPPAPIHENLRQNIDTLTAKALATLKK